MDLTDSLILRVWVSWFFGIPWLLISWCFSFPFLFLFFLCCLLYTARILWHPLLMKLFTYQNKKKDLWASRPCMNGPHQFPHSLWMRFLVFWNLWLLTSCCFSFAFLFFPFLFFLSCLLYTAHILRHHLFWLLMKLFTCKKKEKKKRDLWASRQCYPNNETGTTGGH